MPQAAETTQLLVKDASYRNVALTNGQMAVIQNAKNKKEDDSVLKETILALALALALSFRPLREKLQDIAKLNDPAEMKVRLNALLKEFPDILKQAMKDPAAAEALKRGMASGFVNGSYDASGMLEEREYGLVDFEQAALAAIVAGALLRTVDHKVVKQAGVDIGERADAVSKVLKAEILGDLMSDIESISKNHLDDGVERLRQELDGFTAKINHEKLVKQGDLLLNPKVALQSWVSVKSAEGFGKFTSKNTTSYLHQYPCQELYRAEMRIEWRPWPDIWQENNGPAPIPGPCDYPEFGRMIAPVTSILWTNLSDFGEPFCPLKYGSGMDFDPIARNEAIQLGCIKPDNNQESKKVGFNDTLQFNPNIPDELADALMDGLGDDYSIEDGTIKISNRSGISEATKKAGNYFKRRIEHNGLEFAIETEKGDSRSGTDKRGKPWIVTMPESYGYISKVPGEQKQILGKDGDAVDVYVHEPIQDGPVYVVDQLNTDTKTFDEAKAFIGFPSQDEALNCYHLAFSDGKAWQRMGNITEFTTDEFIQALKDGNFKKPVSDKVMNSAPPPVSTIAAGNTTDIAFATMDKINENQVEEAELKRKIQREQTTALDDKTITERSGVGWEPHNPNLDSATETTRILTKSDLPRHTETHSG